MPSKLSHHLKNSEIRSRIEPDLKENATNILASCGLNMSDAIRLLSSLTNGVIFKFQELDSCELQTNFTCY